MQLSESAIQYKVCFLYRPIFVLPEGSADGDLEVYPSSAVFPPLGREAPPSPLSHFQIQLRISEEILVS